MIRIIIADDHPVVLRGLDALLETEGDVEVVAQCQNGVEALAAVRAHQPDVLLLDLSMPIKTGLQVLRELRAEGNAVRVVLLALKIEEEEILEAIRLGVRGLLLKELALRLLVQCIRKVHAGETWLERDSAARAFESLLRREAATRELSAVLTPRELEILRKLAQGQRNKQLAEVFHISEGTIKTHVHSIYEKLHVSSRAELIIYCRERGIR